MINSGGYSGKDGGAEGLAGCKHEGLHERNRHGRSGLGQSITVHSFIK